MAQKSERDAKYGKSAEYVVVDNPFYDGVQLHPIGASCGRARPASPWCRSTRRARGTAEAPIFADPLGGRGDGAPVKAAKPGDQVVLVQ